MSELAIALTSRDSRLARADSVGIMAPKRRRGGKVVGSVVKTKVVQETVEVTTAVLGLILH